MNLRNLFSYKGLNLLVAIASFGMNIIWTSVLLFVVFVMIGRDEGQAGAATEVVLILGAFLGPFLAGWISGRVADDQRGPTYGLLGSLASLILIVIVILLPAGLIGVLTGLVAVAGGLNGGLMSRRRLSA